jgi:hypothetical protein
MKYGHTVLRINKFHNNTNFDLNNIINNKDNGSGNNIKIKADMDIKEKSAKYPPKDEKDQKPKKQQLPKIREKLQIIYKENPEILQIIKNLKDQNNLTLEEYMLNLIDVAIKFLIMKT